MFLYGNGLAQAETLGTEGRLSLRHSGYRNFDVRAASVEAAWTIKAAFNFGGSEASTIIRGMTLCAAQDAATRFHRRFLIASA